MFANGLSFFFTITTVISLSSFIYIQNFVKTTKFNKVNKVSSDKEILTDKKVMIDNETQTDSFDDIDGNSNSFIEIEYVIDSKNEDSLENLILLAKDQLLIQQSPSNYKWVL